MINLLPPQIKDDYRYARHNSSLLRLLVAFGFGAVGLVLIAAAGVFYLHQTTKSYTAQASQLETRLAEQKQDQVTKQVQEVSGSLKLAVQVLSQEIQFSQLLTQLAVVTPNNVRLNGVNISEFGGGIDITAEASDYDTASQLQINLTDPENKIFSKADIVNITCQSGNSGNTRYPCSVVVRALFAEDNPFLFINDQGGN
jgi:Tfp pilus assembly protein PilN